LKYFLSAFLKQRAYQGPRQFIDADFIDIADIYIMSCIGNVLFSMRKVLLLTRSQFIDVNNDDYRGAGLAACP
jgi:hypothetical protein